MIATKLTRVCSYPGCTAIAHDGTRCEKHKQPKKIRRRDERASAYRRGYNRDWQRYREQFLADHPWCECEDCKRLGLSTPATDVDHIAPHNGDMDLFWDPNNHQAMSHECHARKTAREDGGFGNAVKKGKPSPTP